MYHSQSQPRKLLWLSSAFILISITIFITAASYLVVKPLDFVAPAASPIEASIILTAELLSVDAVSRTLVMNWYPGLPFGCTSNALDFVADIYFNPDLLDASSPSFTSLPPIQPAYQFNATQFCGGTAPIDIPVFQTVTKLLGSNLKGQVSNKFATFQEYPFDIYEAHFLAYAINNNTGANILMNVTYSYGVAVNFEVVPSRAVILGRLDVAPYLQVVLQVRRASAAKAFVVLVGVSNWLVAAAFLVISASAMVYPSPQYYAEMFVLPIGVLFAFTSIRANLPGAPEGFGARIDLYTILPVLVIITLCGFFLLLAILIQRLREMKPAKEGHTEGTQEISVESSKTPIKSSITSTVNDQYCRAAEAHKTASAEARSISMNHFNATASEMSFDDRHTDEGIGYLPW
ncbi:hypothetical protein CVT26_002979 [Gymnopilus dilepis]|uniref:Uncharacterized protein n=1 Tax=Gymnopilus dilepis TaxID=231916 RepID=A0A409WSZ2_9AGAR|nr:hypothetical protein CVT26_002979 [Gymnopilus dilepis]